MTQDINQIWVYLSASPLLGLTITLLAYQGAFWIYQRTGNNPLANPVLIAVSVLVIFLTLTATSYETYFAGAQFVHFLLGPATVALAIPLYTQFKRVRSMLLPVIAGLLAGSMTAIVSAVMVARLLGASTSTQLSLAPKSVTTPIAMGIAERIGGIPSLTASVVIVVGIFGAIFGYSIMKLTRVKNPVAQGLSIGTAAHAIGTSRSMEISPKFGAMSSIGLIVNGIFTAILTPYILQLINFWFPL